MPILGALTLLNNVFPTGVDAGLLATLAEEEGLSQDAAVAMVARRIGQANEELQSRYGGIIRFTSERHYTYRGGTGTRDRVQQSADFTRNFTGQGKEYGHMLPRNDFDDGIDYDENYARRGNARRFMIAVDELADRWLNTVDRDIINRALTNTENSVGSGYDVGWSIGTGTSVDYIPPQYRGKLFTTSHSHYVTANTGSSGTWTTLLTAMFQNIREHGFNDTLTLFISEDNIDDVTGLTANFVDLENPRVIVNTANTNAPSRFVVDGVASGLQGIPGELIGYVKIKGYGQAEVRYHERVPENYCFLTKSFGINNEKNGLAVFIEQPLGFGLNIEPQYRVTPEYKLNRVRVYATHGVGVNGNRLNGVAGLIGNGVTTWTNPSIS